MSGFQSSDSMFNSPMFEYLRFVKNVEREDKFMAKFLTPDPKEAKLKIKKQKADQALEVSAAINENAVQLMANDASLKWDDAYARALDSFKQTIAVI